MRKNKLYYGTLGISIITFLVNILVYSKLPEKVPVHWGINGEVNRFGSRLELVGLGALPVVMFFFLNYLPAIDPKKESYKMHKTAYSIINLVIILFLSCINLIAIASALGYHVPMQKVVPMLLGILFIVLGNYMVQIRHNYFVGFRNPWTLASEYVWKKTHRFGGYVLVMIGLISIVASFLGTIGMQLFFAALVIGVVGIYLYSYLLFKKNS
ncbi:SdpI family protein [Neobacillus niacini]|uniref:SdpI family protein n=1 Tax=Neobacillus niacini TaxID=86668 RepID=UPI00285B9F03|nr:SdpI family protein [Neobacillus niacini]MDR6999759.1 putative membrane protein [Neobacillus niacini]